MSEQLYGLHQCASCLKLGEHHHGGCYPHVPNDIKRKNIPYGQKVAENKQRLKNEIITQLKEVALGQMGVREIINNVPRWISLWKYEPYRGHSVMKKYFKRSGRLSPQT